VAFALVTAAGLSTALGASVVFFPRLVKLASRRVLASSLGLSAGVMIYVSFVEIFFKSQSSFQDAGFSDGKAHICASLCFFCGIFVMIALDVGLKYLTGEDPHAHDDDAISKHKKNIQQVQLTPHCLGCVKDPNEELRKFQEIADVLIKEEEKNDRGEDCSKDCEKDCVHEGEASVVTANTDESTEEKRKLNKMGLSTALAIGLHNFPEGLATFIAALDDPKVGAVLAVAIGIHNIPEGLCVSLPIYYATGNRWKGFLWALLSGLSEPVAAVLGWIVLANYFTDTVFAVLFGLVSGMMIMISLKELIPTAHRYDPSDTVVSYSIVAGMAVMALSLILFLV